MANGNGYSAGNLIIEIQTMSKETNAGLSAMNKNLKTSAFSITNLVNKVYFLRNYTKSMFGSVKTMLNLAVDYTETLNLWQVAMRGNTAEAENFVKTMNKAYGIATQTLMEYQAIFKNMLSSLGGISGDVSYQLSEYLTQMAIDYASLYNTSIERAMTTFQSVLSGQVRPIRSIAGYDITETTIYQLYQQLGGTKTMRQLSQTEKRLLRIYAVFQQMESSGAVGDLAKTMESTSNQMRIMKEATKELMTWLGMLMEDVVRPMLPYINAAIITMTNIIKAFAQLRDIKPQEFGVVESVQELNKQLDETQGKLLSFDRFEALNAGEDNSNILGIDENLLAGLSQYSSILDGVSGKAQELAEQWSKIFIEYDAEGNVVGFTAKAVELSNTLKDIANTLGLIITFKLGLKVVQFFGSLSDISKLMQSFSWKSFGISSLIALLIYGYATNEKLRESINKLFDALMPVLEEIALVFGKLLKSLAPILTIIGDFVGRLIEVLDSLGLLEPAIWLVIAAFTYWKGLQLLDWLGSLNSSIGIVAKTISQKLKIALASGGATLDIFAGSIGLVISGIAVLGGGIAALIAVWDELSEAGRFVTIFVALAAAITATAIALHAFKGDWVKALSVGATVAGGALMVGSALGKMTAFKNGGQVEDGIFTMNKGEIIGNFDDGSTVVANNQQIISGIQQGVYSAVVSAMRQSGNGGVGDVYLDGRKVGQTTAKSSHREMTRIGLVKATR